MNRFAVVFAEEEPDRLKVVEVGFDAPVTRDLRAEALAADAGTTSRDLEQELTRWSPTTPARHSSVRTGSTSTTNEL